jgi:hypothetical protein
VDDIQLEQLETLMGYATAIKDGESSVDEIFEKPVENTSTPTFKKAEKPTENTSNPPTLNYPKFIAKAMAADGITEEKLLEALPKLGKGEHASLETLPVEIQEYIFDQWGTIVEMVKGVK